MDCERKTIKFSKSNNSEKTDSYGKTSTNKVLLTFMFEVMPSKCDNDIDWYVDNGATNTITNNNIFKTLYLFAQAHKTQVIGAIDKVTIEIEATVSEIWNQFSLADVGMYLR